MLLQEKDQEAIRALFSERMDGDVTITYFTQHDSPLIVPGRECEMCSQTRQILEEVAGLSDKIELEVKDFFAEKEVAGDLGVHRIPAFVLTGKARGNVRFFGIPSGYEFSSLIEDVIDVSTGVTNIPEQTREQLAGLEDDVHLQVFVTPTCPYCPGAARSAHKLAIESEHVTADVIEATEFPDMAQRYHIYGVPKTVINETTEFEGSAPDSHLMQQILAALAPEAPVA
jgi:glutaredoxin-like protein